MRKLVIAIFLITNAISGWGTEYPTRFQNVDIRDFVQIVGKQLKKTIVMDPSIKGNINVRSDVSLNEPLYYQFFLSVLDVYGYAAVDMPDHVLKVVLAKNAKAAATPLVDESNMAHGDEIVTRIVTPNTVSVRELAPLLRHMIDMAGSASVTGYEPSNALLMTGQAAVVERLLKVVQRVDLAVNRETSMVKLQHAAASELVKLLDDFNQDIREGPLQIRAVADERTNTIVLYGNASTRRRMVNMLHQLDHASSDTANTQVFYLRYGHAKELAEVLNNIASSMNSSIQGGAAVGLTREATPFISADETTNSLVITASPAVMGELQHVIARLDIQRAQVMVQAVIVEMADGNGQDLGVQWTHKQRGFTQFPGTGLPATAAIMEGRVQLAGNSHDNTDSVLSAFNGMAAGFYHGDWAALMTTLASNSKNDIRSIPSIVTMDNQEASFNVGQEVPVQSGSQGSMTSDTVFNTIERKTVGTKLTVTPQINEGDEVLLELEEEVSSVAQTQALGTNNLGPTFDTRTAKNTVLVKSGEILVLGGLLDERSVEEVVGVPWLEHIPLLGQLFRSTNTSSSKRNLMVFIRPVILNNNDVYSTLSSEKYSYFHAQQLARLERLKAPRIATLPPLSMHR